MYSPDSKRFAASVFFVFVFCPFVPLPVYTLCGRFATVSYFPVLDKKSSYRPKILATIRASESDRAGEGTGWA